MITFNKKYFPNQKFLLALSGGSDSLAACHFLKKKGFDFQAVHVNNQFIPQDDDIAEKVTRFCYKNEIPLNVIVATEKYVKGSKEDFCRRVRYKHLQEYAYSQKLEFLCTVHHLDDCVESYFLNFLKGCPEYVPISFFCKYPQVTIFRPFLLNKKRDFISYLQDNHLQEHVLEDPLNEDLSLMRNWTRKKILPEIEKKYKGLPKVVFKKMKKHLDSVVKE
jgi:tRNA(Ile)-lysidine synthase